MKSIISCVEPLSVPAPFKTLDPFLFCVYHRDEFPAGNERMEAPRAGNGADFNPAAKYRMYHGDRIPGFPQHPHRGFETVTCTMDGLVDHTDSLGCAGRYGNGDLQWMTAGKGVVHGEMFPLINKNGGNLLRFFQIWLNLPKKSKFAEPTYVMHWAEDIQTVKSADGKAEVTVWAGALEDKKGLAPPPDSYANDPDAEVAIYFFKLQPGGSYELPAARGGRAVNRKAYFVEGQTLAINNESLQSRTAACLDASETALLANHHPTAVAEVLVLQGRPIGEPVAQHGPFVMNSQEEISQAFADYRRTQFGGWPWPEDAMVFPRSKGRFSLLKGVETHPPANASAADRA